MDAGFGRLSMSNLHVHVDPISRVQMCEDTTTQRGLSVSSRIMAMLSSFLLLIVAWHSQSLYMQDRHVACMTS